MAKKKPQPAKPPNPWPAKLRALRKCRGLTQAAAAAKVGVAMRTWMSWEYGHRKPSRFVQPAMTAAFPELAD